MDETRRSAKQYSGKPYKKSGDRFGHDRQPKQISTSEAAEDLAEYILKILAKDTDSLHFERQEVQPGRYIITVKCDPSVTGRLIGKDGKVISALRSFIRAAAGRYGKRIDIEIV